MRFDLTPILAVIGFLMFAVVWVWQFNKRIEPWLRRLIGRMMRIEIVQRRRFRNVG